MASLSFTDRSAIEKWLLNAALYFEAVNSASFNLYVVDRKAGNYALTGEGAMRCAANYDTLWYNGPVIKTQAATWNNRNAEMALPYALVAVQQNNSYLKIEAKRYFQEVIAYSILPDGTDPEMERWKPTNPGLGLVYSFTKVGTLIQMADVFARSGDTSLYDYTTQSGNCGTQGGPKNLALVINSLTRFVDHSVLRYGTLESTNATNPHYLIDTNDEIANNLTVLDHVIAQANVYFKNDRWKSIYMRTAQGQNGYSLPGYPPNPSNGGYSPWGGSWGNLPSVMFMFAQMEAKVNPYPGSIATSPNPNPVPTSDVTPPQVNILSPSDGALVTR